LLGEQSRAIPDLVAAQQLYQRAGAKADAGSLLLDIAISYRRMGELGKARAYLGQNEAYARALGDWAQLIANLLQQGYLAEDQGRVEDALAVYRRALAPAREHHSPYHHARIHPAMAWPDILHNGLLPALPLLPTAPTTTCSPCAWARPTPAWAATPRHWLSTSARPPRWSAATTAATWRCCTARGRAASRRWAATRPRSPTWSATSTCTSRSPAPNAGSRRNSCARSSTPTASSSRTTAWRGKRRCATARSRRCCRHVAGSGPRWRWAACCC